MSRMNEIYGAFSVDRPIFKSESTLVFDSISIESHSRDLSRSDDHEFQVQENIRSLFGKTGRRLSQIGGHPDFTHLETTGSQEKGYVVSLFVDIKGSTKLGLVYSPEQVFWIKNQIIKCAMETILAFDGHVHRIMGDAVLAFFRGNQTTPRDSAINAINCGTYLVEFMRSVVSPKMKEFGVQDDVGIRVGVDYGPHEKVIWGMYGYAGLSEVTATSYHVDVAAKLQQRASKNRVMIGQELAELLDLHEDIIECKITAGDEDKYVKPNYTDISGKPKNYRQFVIKHNSYFEMLPKPEDTALPISITSIEINGQEEAELFKCARCAGRQIHIKFSASFSIPGWNHSEIKVRFRVENHGKQAATATDYANHSTEVKATRNENGRYSASNIEPTAYVGLHYMFVSVIDADGKVIHKEQKFPVYIG